MLLTEVWVAIELFVACRWSRSPWRMPLTAVRGVRTGKLEMVHHLAPCKEQACQEHYDAWASLDVDRSTMLTWLLLRRMPTRRWAPANHRVGMNGGQSPEQLYVTCARMYCLVIQLIHNDDLQRWSHSIVVDVQFYADFVAALSAVMFWCWCATCQFVASLHRSSSLFLGSTKKETACTTRVWKTKVRMTPVQSQM